MKYCIVGRGGLHNIIIDILGKEFYRGFYDDGQCERPFRRGSFADGFVDVSDDGDFFLGFASIENMPYREYLSKIFSSNGKLKMDCVHHRSIVSSSVSLGGGGIVCGGAHLGVNVRLGKSVIVFSNSTIEHDSVIGDNVNIGPGVIISGGVTVEDNVFIGAGSTLVDGIHVGSGTVIGAGTTVVSDLEPNSVYVGAPARKIKDNELYRYDHPTF